MNDSALASALLAARDNAHLLPLPTAADPGFDLAAAYAVADELRQQREARGERVRGYKIGFTNRRIWPLYGVHAPIWAPVWDSTLELLASPSATVSLAGMAQPRLEPEIVFGFARAPEPGLDEAGLAGCIAWVAHGFEIVQTHFENWRFAAPDTVADFGLHARLLVGPRVDAARFGAMAPELAAVRLELSRDGEPVDAGQGAAVLDGPLTALRLWLDAMAAQPHGWRVRAGDVVTTGTLTDAWPLEPGQAWRTQLDDPRLAGLTLLVEP